MAKTFSWAVLVQNAEKSNLTAPVDAYLFSNGRVFKDSGDGHGIYTKGPPGGADSRVTIDGQVRVTIDGEVRDIIP